MLDMIKKLKTHNDMVDGSEELYLQIFDDESSDLLSVVNDHEVESFNSIDGLNEYLDDEIAEIKQRKQRKH